MTSNVPSQHSPSTLLIPEHRSQCLYLTGLNEPEASPRAHALTLLDDGCTQNEAAEQSGLSLGQVRYLVRRYKEKGMTLFHPDLLPDTLPAPIEAAASSEDDSPSHPPASTGVDEGELVETPSDADSATVYRSQRKRKKKKRPKQPRPAKKKKKKRKRRKKS